MARVYGRSMKQCGQSVELWWLRLVSRVVEPIRKDGCAGALSCVNQIASPRISAAALRIAEMLAL